MEALVPVDEMTVPVLAVAQEDLEWFELSPQTRSLLRYIDGQTPVEAIAVNANVPLYDVVDAIEQLTRDGLIVCS